MFSRIVRLVCIASLIVAIGACQTPGSGGGTSPIPPQIGPLTVNGQIWANDPLSIDFSRHDLVPESAGTVGINDLLFSNPFSFQVQIRYQFPGNGIEIRENGVPLPILPARTNTKSRASRIAPVNVIDPVTGQVTVRAGTVTEWDWPLPANMIARGVPPPDKSSYSLELIQTCGTRLNPSGGPCANPDTIMLLTISPPTRPADPVQGSTFLYKLIEKGSGSFAGSTAVTDIKAIFIRRGSCQIRSLLLQPAQGKAGELGTADFETSDCRRVVLTVDNEPNPVFDRTAQVFAEAVIDTRKFALPRRTSVGVTLRAYDSAHPESTSLRRTIQIDPCSISATHPQCPADCSANPNDPRCPVNCIASPGNPRCGPCTANASNPRGDETQFDVGMYCPAFATLNVAIFGCTLDAAKQAYPPNAGCVYTTISGTPVGTPAACPGGGQKTLFDMCLSCPVTGSPPALEYKGISDVCTLDEAKQKAIDSLKPRVCTFLKPGTC